LGLSACADICCPIASVKCAAKCRMADTLSQRSLLGLGPVPRLTRRPEDRPRGWCCSKAAVVDRHRLHLQDRADVFARAPARITSEARGAGPRRKVAAPDCPRPAPAQVLRGHHRHGVRCAGKICLGHGPATFRSRYACPVSCVGEPVPKPGISFIPLLSLYRRIQVCPSYITCNATLWQVRCDLRIVQELA